MKLGIIKEILKAEIVCGNDLIDNEVYFACGCDLMSDVLRFAKDEVVLLTGLVNMHVLRTAEMANIQNLIFVRNKKPTNDIVKEAIELGMVIMCTRLPLFEACGKLYKEGLGDERNE